MTDRATGFWMGTMLAAVLIAGRALPAGAEDISLPELKERFAERYPKLVAYKNDGRIGETWEGYVVPVHPERAGEDEKLMELIAAENLDRTRLYRLLAKQEGTDPAHVAHRNAVRNFHLAEPGWFLRSERGRWYRKPGGEDSESS